MQEILIEKMAYIYLIVFCLVATPKVDKESRTNLKQYK